MTAPSAAIVQKLWSYCNVLLDAGLTYLLREALRK